VCTPRLVSHSDRFSICVLAFDLLLCNVCFRLDVSGSVKFGPDVEWLPAEIQPDEIDYAPDQSRVGAFYDSIRKYWPHLADGDLLSDYTGVRPKLSHPSLVAHHQMPFADFCIAGPALHGVSGLVHFFGIESPGMTGAMALAEELVESKLWE